jgi:hypothetical protein
MFTLSLLVDRNLNTSMTRSAFILVVVSFALACCGTLKDSPRYQLGDGSYLYKQKTQKYTKVYVVSLGDSTIIYDESIKIKLHPQSGQTQYFLARSFDIDIMTVGFKYRPATKNLPRQLNTDFNGNVFIGYRFDRFKLSYKSTPVGYRQKTSHRGITVGGFTGVGSTAMTPWTTSNQMADEYNGVVLTRGLAIMVGINTLTVGAGVGWDYLTDRDKHIWIYQNKPWYGLTLGLNLN